MELPGEMGTFVTSADIRHLEQAHSLNSPMRSLLALLTAALLMAAVAAPATATATGESRDSEATTTILVRVRKADRDTVHRATGYSVANRITGIGVDVVTVPVAKVSAALDTYRDRPEVIFAERNRLVRKFATPNDDFVPEQYALDRIRARSGWSDYGHLWRRHGGTRIAIIDSGIDRTHPEFEDRVSHCRSWLTGTGLSLPTCQDSDIHGTHVAGIAAATANNGQGIAGVAFDAQIMALQVLNSAGVGFTSDIAAATVYAARNGAKVANYSLGAPGASKTEHAAIRFAARRGVVQVAAAGNTGEAEDKKERRVQYPARYPEVIAVSATNRANELASYSSRGDDVEVAAPGTQVLSTIPLTWMVAYARLDGTSMASPHVAGLAALLREQGYGPAETRRRIREGAADLGADGRDPKFGFGLINVARSVR